MGSNDSRNHNPVAVLGFYTFPTPALPHATPFFHNTKSRLELSTGDLTPGFLPVTVGSLNILLYFSLGIFHLFLFFSFLTKLNQFCEHFD